jgi:hypothetical protein
MRAVLAFALTLAFSACGKPIRGADCTPRVIDNHGGAVANGGLTETANRVRRRQRAVDLMGFLFL